MGRATRAGASSSQLTPHSLTPHQLTPHSFLLELREQQELRMMAALWLTRGLGRLGRSQLPAGVQSLWVASSSQADASFAPSCSYSTAAACGRSSGGAPAGLGVLSSLTSHLPSSLSPCSSPYSTAPHPASQEKQGIPYATRSGTPRPSPWPVFEQIKHGNTGAIKWQRTLYRFPEGVSVTLEGRRLSLSGRAGTVVLDLCELDPSGLVAYSMLDLHGASKPPVLALASPDKARFDSLVEELDGTVRGVTVGYLVGITVKGVGYRCGASHAWAAWAAWQAALPGKDHPCTRAASVHYCKHTHAPVRTPRSSHRQSRPATTTTQPRRIEPMDEQPRKRSWYFDNDNTDRSAMAYPHQAPVPAVRLKVGYSRTAVFPMPDGVRAFCIKPTLLYLYGLRKEEVHGVAGKIRSVRKPNVYTGNGIRLVDETVRIKARKSAR